jgi:hypothetical protein
MTVKFAQPGWGEAKIRKRDEERGRSRFEV